MSELMMRMFGLKNYVTGGQEMAERLRESGVEDISVVGRGGLVVRSVSRKKASRYRQAAKRIVAHDAPEVAAGNKDDGE